MRRPRLVLICSVFLFAPATTLRAAEDDPKAIIAKAIKAHGGEELLTKYQAARAKNKGKITLPVVGEVDFTQELAYMLPDKLNDQLSLSVMGQEINVATLVNGDSISIETNGKAVNLTDAIKESLKEARHMMKVSRLATLVKDKGYTLSLLSEVMIEGKPAVGVHIESKGHKDINLFFDRETGLLAKLEHQTADPAGTGNEINEERIILEYQKGVEGMPVPKRVLIKHDGKKFLEAEVAEFKLLEKIDDSEFKK